MRKSPVMLIAATVLAASFTTMTPAFAGKPGQEHSNPTPPQNTPASATANANQHQYQSTASTSKSDSTALAGAYSGSLSGASAQSGDSYAKTGDSNANSGSESSSQSGDSTSGSTAGSDVNINSFHEGDRYPDIPVNAGVVFASLCQEGSSATNSKISIALVTDSSYCNRLMQADAEFKMFAFYAKQCNADLNSLVASIRHDRLIASQVKGSKPMTESDYDDNLDPESCEIAEQYRISTRDELDKAKKLLDRTTFTGLIAKWSAQLGIPASILYVLVGAL